MTIKQLQKICHNIAVQKGFWSEKCEYCCGKGKREYYVANNSLVKKVAGDHDLLHIKETCEECKGTGYVRIDRNNGELIALMHSELSEALEDLRTGHLNHVGEELADCVIRILDYCEGRNIDLQKEVLKKIKKNKGRKYKHGKAF